MFSATEYGTLAIDMGGIPAKRTVSRAGGAFQIDNMRGVMGSFSETSGLENYV